MKENKYCKDNDRKRMGRETQKQLETILKGSAYDGWFGKLPDPFRNSKHLNLD